MQLRAPILLVLALLAVPAQAQQPVPKVPDGFQVEIVLQAPDIEAPTALCVAPNGDVYFAEDPMDMSGPPTKNLDKIWLLKGGDPKKKVLFADEMWAVMGWSTEFFQENRRETDRLQRWRRWFKERMALRRRAGK